MKYIKYTYVDGNHTPQVAGLEFAWARESQYPTSKPEFFGTCPADSDVSAAGVLGVYSKEDWDVMHSDEMRARVPKVVTMRQARLALLSAGLLDQVETALSGLEGAEGAAARIEWDYSSEVHRDKEFVALLGQSLGLDDDGIDSLFTAAAGIK